MQSFLSLIQSIAKRIAASETKRQKLADFVKQVSPNIAIKQPVTPDSLESTRIAAVDGGIQKKSFHGMDCLLVRAAGVCFTYKQGAVADVQYFPSRSPVPRPEIFESLSELDWNHFSSIHRLKEEVAVATACLEQFKPDLLLLDGMLLPHSMDRPAKGSPIYETFHSLLQGYKKLFAQSQALNVPVAGVIEDSRNTLFCEHIRTELLSKITHPRLEEIIDLLGRTRDSNLLYLILERGERTRSFSLVQEGFPPMRTFYLKTAQFDRPLKVDFLEGSIEENRLASLLLAVSGHHSGYGLPTPLIEADNVAKLPETEMENFYSTILSLTGATPSLMKLRREQRPF